MLWCSSRWVESALRRLKANTALPHNHHPPRRQPAPRWRRLVERQQSSSSSLLLQVPSGRWPAWRTVRHRGTKRDIRSQILKSLNTHSRSQLLTTIDGVPHEHCFRSWTSFSYFKWEIHCMCLCFCLGLWRWLKQTALCWKKMMSYVCAPITLPVKEYLNQTTPKQSWWSGSVQLLSDKPFIYKN